MGKVRRTFDKEFKLNVVRELEAGKDITQVCREHSIREDLVYRWKQEYRKDPTHAFAGKGVPATAEAKIAELEREVGKMHMQNEFLKKCAETLRLRKAGSRRAFIKKVFLTIITKITK